MKRTLILAALVGLLCAPAFCIKTIESTVAFTDAQGNALANGWIVFTLNAGARLITGGQIVIPSVTVTLDATGKIPANTQLIANDEMMPTGTMYIVRIYNSNGTLVRGPENWIISGASPIDLSGETNSSTPDPGLASPVIQNPVANQTITQPAGTSLTISGAFNPQLLQKVVYANSFAGDWCQQVTEADTFLGNAPGVIIYPPTGTTQVCTHQPVIAFPQHTLWLQAGNYEMNASTIGQAGINIQANQVEIRGDGVGKTTLFMGPASQDDAIRSCMGNNYPTTCGEQFDVQVHDLTVDGCAQNISPCAGAVTPYSGGGSDTYQNGVNLNTPSRNRIYSVHITNVPADGIDFAAFGPNANLFSGNYTLSGTTLTASTGGSFDTSGAWTGLPIMLGSAFGTALQAQISTVTDATHLTIMSASGFAASGVYAVLANYGDSADHNWIDHYGGIGIGCEGQLNHCTIADNPYIGSPQNVTGFTSSVGVEVSASSGLVNPTLGNQWNVEVKNNFISLLRTTDVGIYAVDNLFGVKFEGNTCIGLGGCIQTGVQDSTVANTNLQIVGNKALNSTGSSVPVFSITNPTATNACGYLIANNKVETSKETGFNFANLCEATIVGNVAFSPGSLGFNGVTALTTNSLFEGNQVYAQGGPFGFSESTGSTGNRFIANIGSINLDAASGSENTDNGSGNVNLTNVQQQNISTSSPQDAINVGAGVNACYGFNKTGIVQWTVCNQDSDNSFDVFAGAHKWFSINAATGLANFADVVQQAGVNVATTAQLPLPGTTGTITGTALSASCDSGTATVTGAVVGSPVAVSSTTGVDVGGAFYLRASVTATNTVTVYVCGTGTPSSLAYNVRVIQ